MASWRTTHRVQFEQVAQADVAQGAAAGFFAGRLVGRRSGRARRRCEFSFRQLRGQMPAQAVAGGVQGIGIDDSEASASVDSPGRVRASATKAAPRSAGCSRRRAAATKPAGQTGVWPAAMAAVASRISCEARRWPASQALNGSLSWASSRVSCSGV
jgi:hypothetical protein